MYNPHETYMANMMARDGYLEHALWGGKPTKYINKFMKNGKWVYQYANDLVGKKVTGSYYKNRMEKDQKAANAAQNMMKTFGKGTQSHAAASDTYKARRASWQENRRGYEGSLAFKMNKTINDIRSTFSSTLSRGKSMLSRMFGKKAAVPTTIKNQSQGKVTGNVAKPKYNEYSGAGDRQRSSSPSYNVGKPGYVSKPGYSGYSDGTPGKKKQQNSTYMNNRRY